MNGLKITLPTTVTDTTMPILYPDAIMSKGSLFLIDPSNSAGGSPTLLTNGGTVPNLAWKTASDIIGSGTSSTLAGTIGVSGITSSTAILEMTGKKGIHFLYSKLNGTSTTQWTCVLPLSLRQYLLTNWTTKKLYVSIWGQVTRTADTATSGFLIMGNSAGVTSNYKVLMETNNNQPTTTPGLGTRVEPLSANTVGPFIRTIATSGSIGTTPTSDATLVSYAKLGAGGPYGGFELNKCASRIIYRIYIEDLDVSGRTYAEVDAIDKAMYDSAFSSTGKYFGDTFTSPSVLP